MEGEAVTENSVYENGLLLVKTIYKELKMVVTRWGATPWTDTRIEQLLYYVVTRRRQRWSRRRTRVAREIGLYFHTTPCNPEWD